MKPLAMKLILVLAALTMATLVLAGVILGAHRLSAEAQAAGPIALEDPRVDDWVITVNISDASMHVVNATDNSAYGPFLVGQLGEPNEGLLDVAVTPDGKTALLSNFGAEKVYFVDVTNPVSPSLLGSVDTPMFAEDIAITPDGAFALATDGGFSSLVASIDIISRTLVYTLDLDTRDAQAVDVAPNGTVIAANYWGGSVETLVIDAAGHLTHVQTITSTYGSEPPWPINVGVAPDGETVIVTYAFTDAVGIYRVTGPGTLNFMGVITGLPGSQQSVAFNPAGDKAFVVSEAPTGTDKLSVLDITGPGIVSLNEAGAADLLSDVSGSLYGVDVIAIAGDKAFVGHPSTFGITMTNELAVVDLGDYSVTALPVGEFPHGVAALPPMRQVIVEKQGPGSGVVTSEPQGIACGIICTALFDYGTQVALTAKADSGAFFVGWEGACTGIDVCTLIVTETQLVTATFNARLFLPVIFRSD